MAVKFKSISDDTLKIAEKLLQNYKNNITLNIQKGDCLSVSLENCEGTITYSQKTELFRGLGHILSGKIKIDIKEKAHFKMLGAMLDMSRNGVMKPQKLKEYLEYMALMGFNCLMLYNEDVYEVDGYPFFGYMRGRYTKEEIKEIDDYAFSLGIEVIPCIQTLGHMEQYLKWSEGNKFKDTSSVLLSESELTYKFLEDIIKTATEPLRSKQIHIGMDEAHDIGLGRYLSINGYKDRSDILVDHLNKVVQITEKYELKPMMWGDMFFRLASPRHAYYDLETKISDDIKKRVPKGMGIIYWDYYNNDIDFYKAFIDTHLELSENTIFAGGVWTWRGIMPDYHTTIATTLPALSACIEKGVQQVIATLWGDDGAENSYFTALGGLQIYAEYCYGEKAPSMEAIAQRYFECTGGDFSTLLEMSLFHNVRNKPHEEIIKQIATLPMNDILRGKYQCGKRYMWQDILCGVFDNQIISNPASDVYKTAFESLKNYNEKEPWGIYNALAEATYDFMILKAYVAENLIKVYNERDISKLKHLMECLNNMKPKLEKLRELHRKVWFSENKAFGWETLDIRYGGVLMRIDTAILRLNELAENPKIIIEELEEERLPFLRIHEDWRYRSFATCGIL